MMRFVLDGGEREAKQSPAARGARPGPRAQWEGLEPRVLLSASPVGAAGPAATPPHPGTHRHHVHVPAALGHLKFHPFLDAPLPTAASGGESAGAGAGAAPTAGLVMGTAAPTAGLTPEQMRGAYGVGAIHFGGVAGDGSGQTIAIVDPFDDPAFVNSGSATFPQSDLALFDAQFGLPDPPSFTKYGVDDNTDTVTPVLPGTDPNGPAITTGFPGGELEESLDVEWAHAIAPAAAIVLIESSSFADIFDAVAAADNLGAAGVVSMSFGGPESQVDLATEQDFQDPNSFSGIFAVPGITFVAGSGDSGAFDSRDPTMVAPVFPAALTAVVAAGGTTLNVSGDAWAGETTWGNGTSSGTAGGAGGGVSLYQPVPAWQQGVATAYSTTHRAYPDVSMESDPKPGVPVLDSWDFGSGTGWYPGSVGGTSLATPMFAALTAIASQGRAAANLLPLDSSGLAGDVDIHTLLYAIGKSPSFYAADFHDITAGNAIGPTDSTPSFAPGPGYDLATGLGSPAADRLVPDLAAPVPASTLTVNDGSAQRSEVKSLTVTFNTAVALQDGAITLTQRTIVDGVAVAGTGMPVALTVSNPTGDLRTYLVTFNDASGASGPAPDFGSLPDGVYDLTVHAGLVANAAGDVPSADATFTFHRLFGDTDGNATVNALDYARFKAAFGSSTGSAAYNPALDFDGNGAVNALDYAQFKKRFGTMFVY